MSNFYDSMQTVTRRLINEYGTSCSLIKYEEDNTQTLLSEQFGVSGPVKDDDYANTLVEKAEMVVYIPHYLVVPDTTNYLIWNDEVYKIIYVNRYKPARQDILYGLYLRK